MTVLHIGEFGLYRDCFKKNKGGILWVEDLISLLLKYDVNFTYHSYHEYAFGLYFNEDGLPDPKYINKELLKLFKSSQLIEN